MTTHKGRNYLSKGIKKTALSLALGACFVGGVSAQTNTAGAVGGRAAAGDTVTISNPATGVTRTVTVGSDGTYRLAQLPIGTYTVTRNGGEAREVRVSVGTSSTVDFVNRDATNLEALTVIGTVINPIDVSSVESTVVLTEEQIDKLPIARDTTSLALLAPGTTLGDARMGSNQKQGGKLASFGGSSVAENVYYINGFNVTNLVNGVAFNELPFEAISETQIKNGGYGAEFGRSLGGVVNVIGKRGTNEWKFGGNAIWSPNDGRSDAVRYIPDPNLFFVHEGETDPRWTRTPTPNDWHQVKRPSYNESIRYNAYASGPIVKDKLFFYALAQGTDSKVNAYGQDTQSATKSDAPQYYVKLDWNITDNHLLEVTAFRDTTEDTVSNWDSSFAYGKGKANAKLGESYKWGGDNYIGKWTGYFGDNLTLSALYGVGKYDHTSEVGASDCPFVRDYRTPTPTDLGCWTVSSIDDPRANEKRTAYRFDGEWVLGDHTIKFGLDNEEYDFLGGSFYTGYDGTTRQIRTLAAGGSIANAGYTNTGTTPINYVQMRHFENGGQFTLKNSAYYLEDSWQVTDNFLTYLGIRNESFENLNALGGSFIKIDNTWAPRLGFSWDVNGDSSFKIFGNLGRYYIPVMGNTNIRLSGAELDYTDYYAFDGVTFTNDIYEEPVRGAQLGSRFYASTGETPDPRTVVDPDIKPMFQDELILGFQAQLSEKWVGGVRGVYRELSTVMDDYCSHDMPEAWALDNGYTAAQADAIGDAVAHCFLMNVGEDLTMYADLGDADLTKLTIPASALGIPKAKRKYAAMEFFFERVWDDKWTLQGSYTFAKNKGNTEGYVKSDIGQDDAGISAGFDYPTLAEGGYGYLPNDRRHAFKLFGAYQISDEWLVGGNLLIQSGRPLNCLGAVPAHDDGTYGDGHFPEPGYDGYAMYCNGVLVPRGTAGRLEWSSTLSGSLTYQPKWAEGLRLTADVFNILNDRSVLAVNEQCEFATDSIENLCHQPIATNAPRSFRFTVEYDF